jgi:apolipoprotein N-acyltransferase
MPYCTGDVHVGDNVVTYTDPAGVNPPITWRHVGYNNTRKALDYLHARFPTVGKLLVSGFSAGGTATNAVYYQARRWRWRRGERAWPGAILIGALLAVLASAGYGLARIDGITRSLEGAPSLRVGLVQGNLGVLEKRREADLVHRRYLDQTRELLSESELDLAVWPETVHTRGLLGPLPISGEGIREELRVPLPFGAATVRAEGGRRRTFNSALLIGADGAIRSGYDENLPVQFAEQVPLAARIPWLASLFPHAQQFTAGSGAPPLVLGSFRISTPICSESAEPAFVRRMVAEAAPHLIVGLANDAWFGDSQEPWIHLAVTRLRAAEHKRFLVHASNSGVSAVVDPFGRVLVRSGLLTRESLHAEVRPRDVQTLYARLGDWPGWLALAILLAAVSRSSRSARAA